MFGRVSDRFSIAKKKTSGEKGSGAGSGAGFEVPKLSMDFFRNEHVHSITLDIELCLGELRTVSSLKKIWWRNGFWRRLQSWV